MREKRKPSVSELQGTPDGLKKKSRLLSQMSPSEDSFDNEDESVNYETTSPGYEEPESSQVVRDQNQDFFEYHTGIKERISKEEITLRDYTHKVIEYGQQVLLTQNTNKYTVLHILSYFSEDKISEQESYKLYSELLSKIDSGILAREIFKNHGRLSSFTKAVLSRNWIYSHILIKNILKNFGDLDFNCQRELLLKFPGVDYKDFSINIIYCFRVLMCESVIQLRELYKSGSVEIIKKLENYILDLLKNKDIILLNESLAYDIQSGYSGFPEELNDFLKKPILIFLVEALQALVHKNAMGIVFFKKLLQETKSWGTLQTLCKEQWKGDSINKDGIILSSGDNFILFFFTNCKLNDEDARYCISAILNNLSDDEKHDLLISKDIEGKNSFDKLKLLPKRTCIGSIIIETMRLIPKKTLKELRPSLNSFLKLLDAQEFSQHIHSIIQNRFPDLTEDAIATPSAYAKDIYDFQQMVNHSVENLIKEVENKDETIKTLELEKAQLSEQLESTKDKVSQLEKKEKQLCEQNGSLCEVIKKHAKETEELKQEKDLLISQYKNKLRKLEEEAEGKNKIIFSHTERVKNLQSENENLKKEHFDQEGKILQLEKENKRLQQDLKSSKCKTEEFIKEKKKLTDLFEAYKNQSSEEGQTEEEETGEEAEKKSLPVRK